MDSARNLKTGKPLRASYFRPLACLAALLFASGCTKHETSPALSMAPGPALYGEPTGRASQSIARVQPQRGTNENWTTAQFSYLQTELSPATLFHSAAQTLSLFTHLPETGLGAPAYASFNTPTGPKDLHQQPDHGRPLGRRKLGPRLVRRRAGVDKLG